MKKWGPNIGLISFVFIFVHGNLYIYISSFGYLCLSLLSYAYLDVSTVHVCSHFPFIHDSQVLKLLNFDVDLDPHLLA